MKHLNKGEVRKESEKVSSHGNTAITIVFNSKNIKALTPESLENFSEQVNSSNSDHRPVRKRPAFLGVTFLYFTFWSPYKYSTPSAYI